MPVHERKFTITNIPIWYNTPFYMCSKTDESNLIQHTHTHPFNGPLSGTTRVSRYQKGKTNLDFTEARDSEWQWNLLGHMQVCTSLQTDNHASTPPLSFYRPDALPATQPTASKHWRHTQLNPTHGAKKNLKNTHCNCCCFTTDIK